MGFSLLKHNCICCIQSRHLALTERIIKCFPSCCYPSVSNFMTLLFFTMKKESSFFLLKTAECHMGLLKLRWYNSSCKMAHTLLTAQEVAVWIFTVVEAVELELKYDMLLYHVSQLHLQTLTGPFDYTLHIVNHITRASLQRTVCSLFRQYDINGKTYLHCICNVLAVFQPMCPVNCVFIITMGDTTNLSTHVKTPISSVVYILTQDQQYSIDEKMIIWP